MKDSFMVLLAFCFFVVSTLVSLIVFAVRNDVSFLDACKVLWYDGFVAGFKDMAQGLRKAVKALPHLMKKFVARWYGPFCRWLEQYRRQHRPRFQWGPDLECELRRVLADYCYNLFYPYLNAYSGVPGVIQIQYITQKAATDEEVQECMELLVMKFKHYMASYNLSMPFFPYYIISGNEVSIFILYCEYEQEQSDFYNTIHTVIMTKTTGSFGTLKECHIPKRNGDEIVLGYSATKWNDGGIVSPYIWACSKTDPHLLISGPTGGSKTTTLMLIVRQLLSAKKDLRIADYKASKDWDEIFHSDRFGEYTDCDRIVNEFYELFVESIKNKEYHERYLIIDEFGSFVSSHSRADLTDLMTKLKHIAFMGRSFGYHLILVSQQFNANVLPTELRDNFQTRIHMGQLHTETQRMLFENQTVDKSKPIKRYTGFISAPNIEFDTIVIPELQNVQHLKSDLIALGQKYYT